MLIEVADSSYAKDRGTKWRKYAAIEDSGLLDRELAIAADRGLHRALGPRESRRVSGYARSTARMTKCPLILEGPRAGTDQGS